MPDQLIPLKTERLREARPDWPWSGHMTWRMIRSGQLGCVRIGRRVYVTPELMAEFIARNTHRAP